MWAVVYTYNFIIKVAALKKFWTWVQHLIILHLCFKFYSFLDWFLNFINIFNGANNNSWINFIIITKYL